MLGDFSHFLVKVAELWRLETGIKITDTPIYKASQRIFVHLSLVELVLGWRRSADRARLHSNSLLSGNLTGKFMDLGSQPALSTQDIPVPGSFLAQFPNKGIREIMLVIRDWIQENREDFLAR